MNFNEWLNLDEARWRSVGGAFGNQRTANAPNRLHNQFQGIDQRVNYGKGIEKQIYDSLVACGLKLRPATTRDDKYGKIDGWWSNGGQEYPIQIKYRDTGDDILFEVLKDYQRGIPGRDMSGSAVYYAVLNRAGGHIVMVEVAEAKKIIEALMAAAQQSGFDERGNYRMRVGGGVSELKIRRDPQSGQSKLMAYLPVASLKSVQPPCSARVKLLRRSINKMIQQKGFYESFSQTSPLVGEIRE